MIELAVRKHSRTSSTQINASTLTTQAVDVALALHLLPSVWRLKKECVERASMRRLDSNLYKAKTNYRSL